MRSKSNESIMAPAAIAPDQGRSCVYNLDLLVSALAPLSYKRTGFLSALVGLLQDKALAIPLFAPAGEHFEKRGRTLRILSPNIPYARVLPLSVVVAWRAGILVLGQGIRFRHQLDPLSHSLRCRLDGRRLAGIDL